MKEYLQETALLDFNNQKLQSLIEKKNWSDLDDKNKILSVYNFIRDEIAFGYNIDDSIPASKVLSDGIGQCNTKVILFMAILRALNIPCRVHGFMVNKELQKGAMKGFYYKLAPKEIVHSWAEIFYNDKWLNLEGFILDINYVKQLQVKFSECEGSFCGYGVATNNFKNPQIEWNENDTYIQKESISQDLGVFINPDDFFNKYHQLLSPFKKFMFRYIVRHLMNRNVEQIRKQK